MSTSDIEPHQPPSKRIHPYIKPYLRGVALFPLVVIGSWIISVPLSLFVGLGAPYLFIAGAQIVVLGYLGRNRQWPALIGYVAAYIVNIILTGLVIGIFEAFSPGTLGMLLPSVFAVLSLLGAPGWLLIIIYSLL